jgi:hypothetical protein
LYASRAKARTQVTAGEVPCRAQGEPNGAGAPESLYFACRVPETGGMKIMYSIKQDNGTWGVAAFVD